MTRNVKIGDLTAGKGHRPIIVAELSGNHQQSFELAKEMIKQAAKCGVDAIKLQTYTADTMTLNLDLDDFKVEDDNSLWAGQSLHQLYTKAATPWEWHQPLFEYAQQLGLIGFSSPFDESAVMFLDSLNVPCYKVASFEITDIPLLKAIAATGKPVIMSTGMASIDEIQLAIDTIQQNQGGDIILLKCTSAYPASIEDAHLNTISDMQQRFNLCVGLSDHTLGLTVPTTSVALGACLIEKHFVLDRNAGGVDAAFSLDPPGLKQLVEQCKQSWLALGEARYGGSEAEQGNRRFRRSIYVKRAIKKGEVLSKDNIQIIRPAFGLAPKYWEQVLGQVAKQDLSPGTPLSLKHVEG